jgi:lactoylglutathione lyase
VKLANVRLLTADFAASYAFWRDVMQLPVAYGPETPNAPDGYAYLTFGDSTEGGIELFNRDGFAQSIGQTPATGAGSPQIVLVLKVDDTRAAYADLIARGATAVAEPKDRPEWGATTAHISDPDGNIIEIYAPLGGNA